MHGHLNVKKVCNTIASILLSFLFKNTLLHQIIWYNMWLYI